MMKRSGRAGRCLALLLAALLLALSGCSDPPVRTDDVTSPERYMEFNSYVRGDLEEAFAAVFPAEPGGEAQYRYAYTCAVFGDPNYYIWLREEYPSGEEYEAEIARLGALSSGAEAGADGSLFLLGTPGDLAALLDDETRDGQAYALLIVRTDDEAQTVEYCYLHEYDGSPHREALRGLLEGAASLYAG